jgi:hypothetical protein
MLGVQKRQAAGPVHMDPIRNHISGRDFALQALKPAEGDEDDDDDGGDEDDE